MGTFTEGHHALEFLLSELPGHQSRDKATLISGQNLPAGRVLGRITASGKYTEMDPGASDGSQIAAAILYGNTDATSADTECVVIARGAEVREVIGYVNFLGTADVSITWKSGTTDPQKATARGELASVGIITRN